MSWDAIATMAEKIGLIAIVVLVGFVISKLVARLLVDVTIWSNTDTKEQRSDPADALELSIDSYDWCPGLHVLSADGAQDRLVDKNPTVDIIRATIGSLDWAEGFHHVVLVTSPGVSLEVGGSLDPDIGLSSSYADENNSVVRIIRDAPVSVEHMEDLLVSFHLGDGRWEKLNEYE